MKFRIAGRPAPSGTGQQEPPPTTTMGSSASARMPDSKSATQAATTTAPARPAPVDVRGSRLSVEALSSPRTGRPLLTISTESVNKETQDLAFQVPETPPRGSRLGKHILESARGFSLEAADDVAAAEEPFPQIHDEGARHVVCQDSLIPWTYLLSIPGKNVRDILIDAFNEWLRCSPANLAVIKQVIGYLHTGSLIIDDIEDESLTRRGQPSAHVEYGIARSLNAGNYVYFLAMEKVLTLQSTECVMVFTNEMLNLHRGQGRDIFWRTTSYIASEEEYTEMVCDKTGGLFRMAIRFMQLLSSQPEMIAISRPNTSSSFATVDVDTGVTTRVLSPSTSSRVLSPSMAGGRVMSPSVYTATSDFTQLANQLALYFQIRDDLINLASPAFHQKKGFCEDITEGKLSFMALHSLRTYRNAKKQKEFDELLALLHSKTEDRTKIKRALALMDATNSFEYTIKYLKDLYGQAEASIATLGRNLKLTKLLEMIASEVEDCHDVRKRVIEAK